MSNLSSYGKISVATADGKKVTFQDAKVEITFTGSVTIHPITLTLTHSASTSGVKNTDLTPVPPSK